MGLAAPVQHGAGPRRGRELGADIERQLDPPRRPSRGHRERDLDGVAFAEVERARQAHLDVERPRRQGEYPVDPGNQDREAKGGEPEGP